jgi:hypothetical protein
VYNIEKEWRGKNDMKLSADAVICKGGYWYEGGIDGFDFKILKRITKSDDVLAPMNHVTAKQFLWQKGVKDDDNKILRTLLKSIKIYAYTDKSKIAQKVGQGIEKLFIVNQNKVETYKEFNFLCAQCVWTCKQSENVKLYSCKAFKKIE